MTIKNLKCKVFGHDPFEPFHGVEVCGRCGSRAAYYIDGSQWTDKEREGLIGPLRRLLYRGKTFGLRRCAHCNRIITWKAYSHDFCQKKCFNEWMPF